MSGRHRTAPAAPLRREAVASPAGGEAEAARRLELHAARLERVLAALRSQARGYGPHAPAPLRHAIDDYQAELAAVRRLLAT
jgi:hypothetical protein